MWYAVQVLTGKEKDICIQAEKIIPAEILEQIFVPYKEEKRHVNKQWKTIKKVLFPGYIFLITDHIVDLYIALKDVIGLTKVLGTGREIVPLTEEEVQLLQRLGNEEQVVEMSEGIIENDIIHVTSGPLMGMEGCIKKIDRHKRKAWVEVKMFNRMQLIPLGLEIIQKNGT